MHLQDATQFDQTNCETPTSLYGHHTTDMSQTQTDLLNEQNGHLPLPILQTTYSDKHQPPINAILDILNDIHSSSPDLFRVKLFQVALNSGQWVERGTGTVALTRDDEDKFYLIVSPWYTDPTSSSDLTPLLHTAILSNTNYSLQGKVIITWIGECSPRCLSFVKEASCSKIWEALQLIAPDRIGEEDEDDDEDEDEVLGESHRCLGQSRKPIRHILNDDEDDDDGMEEQLKSRGVLPGGLSTLLEDYEDSVLQHPLDSDTSPMQLSPSGRQIPSMIPPDTPDALNDCLEHIRFVERNAPSLPLDVNRTLTIVTESAWLSSLWMLLYRSIQTGHSMMCSNIAELLCRVVSIYALTSNPFVSLALSPDSPRFLDPSDPLVRLLSDTHYPNFFKAMEYESELRKHSMKVDHVEFLRTTSHYNDIICKEDEAFRITCHFIYRILYLRDVCLPRHLDEPTIQRLTALINTGYAYLCRIIQLTPNSLRDLKEMIKEHVPAAKFLLHLLSVLRSNIVATQEKPQIFNSLKTDHVLEALEGYLTGDCPAARDWKQVTTSRRQQQYEAEKRMAIIIEHDVERRHRPHLLSHERLSIPTLPEIAVEILHLTVEYNPGLLRTTILRQAASNVDELPTFWYALCQTFKLSDNEGLHIQLSEIFRKVLDPATVESPERDDFLSLFYDKGVIDQLIEILLTPVPQTYKDLFPLPGETHSNYFIPTRYNHSESSDDDDKEAQHDDVESINNLKDDNRTNRHSSFQLTHTVHSPTELDMQQTPLQHDASITPHGTDSWCDHQSTQTEVLPSAKRRATTSSLLDIPISQKIEHPLTHSMVSSSFLEDDGTTIQAAQTPNDDLSPTLLMKEVPNTLNEMPVLLSKKKSKLQQHIEMLTEVEKEELLIESRAQLSFAKCQISEILAFCVLKHKFRIKYRNFQQNLHLRVIQMSYEPIFDQFLAIYAVKFLRACLTAEAEHYAKIFIRHNIFQSLLFLLNSRLNHEAPRSRGEGSLLESVILEFFNFISISFSTSSAMASLVKAMYDRYADEWDKLNRFYSDVCQYDLFQQLRNQYDSLSHTDRRTSLSDRDSLGDHGTWDGTQNDEIVGTFNRRVSRVTGRLYRPQDERETEREIQESYFSMDDPEEDDLHQTHPTSLRHDDRLLNTAELKTEQTNHLQFSAFLRSAGVSTDTHNDPLLPNLNFFPDDDEDDADVPDFLKNNPQSTTSDTFALSGSLLTLKQTSSSSNLLSQLTHHTPNLNDKDHSSSSTGLKISLNLQKSSDTLGNDSFYLNNEQQLNIPQTTTTTINSEFSNESSAHV